MNKFRGDLSVISPITTAGLCIVLFMPVFGVHLTWKTAMVLHYFSFIILGVGFEVPEISLNLWSIYRSGQPQRFLESFSQVKRVLAVRYILTHFIGPCSGIMVVTSGLYLAYVADYSYKTGWLFWILIASTIGLYKGFYQHNFFIRQLWGHVRRTRLDDRRAIESIRYVIRSPFDHVLIFFEFPTYIFSFVVATYRFPLANPLSGWIGYWEGFWGAKVYVGIMILLSGSILLIVLRFLVRRFSRIWHLEGLVLEN